MSLAVTDVVNTRAPLLLSETRSGSFVLSAFRSGEKIYIEILLVTFPGSWRLVPWFLCVREGAVAAISELLCDVTVLTQCNHGNQFAEQVQIDEKEREREIRTVWRVWSVNGKL
jgi:hypothetical protein